MIGERTVYRKIQVILDYAKDGRHNDKDSLVSYIVNQKPTNFIYYYRNVTTDEIEHGYSVKSIVHTIQLCIDLKLLSAKALTLTKIGVSASDPRRFPSIVGKKTSEFLEDNGVPLSSITNAIRKILRSSNPNPPTGKEIWDRLQLPDEGIKYRLFRQLICLLGQCKVLMMSQKRIYLPPSP